MSWTLRMTPAIRLMMRKQRTMMLQETMSSKNTVRSGRVGLDHSRYLWFTLFSSRLTRESQMPLDPVPETASISPFEMP